MTASLKLSYLSTEMNEMATWTVYPWKTIMSRQTSEGDAPKLD